MSGFQGYDQWKTTEPESSYDPPEETLEEANDRVCAQYEARIALLQRMLHDGDRFKAALRKIAAWQGYSPPADREYVSSQYERGANDMLATLKQMAEEALQ